MKKKHLKIALDGRTADLGRARGEVERLRRELQVWAEAQDSIRAEWLGIVEVLGQIVPVIENETTLGMVKRIQARHQKAIEFIEVVAGKRGSILLPLQVMAENLLKELKP